MKHTKSILRFLYTFGIIIFSVIMLLISESYTKQHLYFRKNYGILALNNYNPLEHFIQE